VIFKELFQLNDLILKAIDGLTFFDLILEAIDGLMYIFDFSGTALFQTTVWAE
jgi:hypothetical protein